MQSGLRWSIGTPAPGHHSGASRCALASGLRPAPTCEPPPTRLPCCFAASATRRTAHPPPKGAPSVCARGRGLNVRAGETTPATPPLEQNSKIVLHPPLHRTDKKKPRYLFDSGVSSARKGYSGGLGRNRTTDTRIFNPHVFIFAFVDFPNIIYTNQQLKATSVVFPKCRKLIEIGLFRSNSLTSALTS